MLGPDHPNTINAFASLAWIKLAKHRYEEAERLLRDVLPRYEKSTPNSWRSYYAQSMLGASLAGLGKMAEAQPLLKAGYEGLLQHQDSIPFENRSVLDEVHHWVGH